MSDEKARPLAPPASLPSFVSSPSGAAASSSSFSSSSAPRRPFAPPQPPNLNPAGGAPPVKNPFAPSAGGGTSPRPAPVKPPSLPSLGDRQKTEGGKVEGPGSETVVRSEQREASAPPAPPAPATVDIPRNDVRRSPSPRPAQTVRQQPVATPAAPAAPAPVKPATIGALAGKAQSPSSEVPLTPPAPQSPLGGGAVIDAHAQSPVDVRQMKKSTGLLADAHQALEALEVGEEDGTLLGGLSFGWITQAVSENKWIGTMAEKAKAGMETVMTTLDPGMKDFLVGDGAVELYIGNDCPMVASSIRDGFERVFSSVMVRSVPLAKKDLAPLVDGIDRAKEGCQKRVLRMAASRLGAAASPFLVLQPFIMEIDGRPHWQQRLLIRWRDHDLWSVSQPMPVEADVMQHLQKRAKEESSPAGTYPIGVAEAAHELSPQDPESWAGSRLPHSFTEVLIPCASILASEFLRLTERDADERARREMAKEIAAEQ